MNNTTTITLLLDTGSQITTIDRETAATLVTSNNIQPTKVRAISADGNITDDLMKVKLTTSDGNEIDAYFSPKIDNNLMSLDVLTKQLNKSAFITNASTHIIENDSRLHNIITQLITNSKQNSEVTSIQNKNSLIPISLTFNKINKPTLEDHLRINALGHLPYRDLIPISLGNSLEKSLNLSHEDQEVIAFHKFYHYQAKKLSEIFQRPISLIAHAIIKACHICKTKAQNNPKRKSKHTVNVDLKLQPRVINNMLNPYFRYELHLDTLKIKTNFQSESIKSVITILIKPFNYIQLLPISTSQPTKQETFKMIIRFLQDTVQIPPYRIVTDRGNEFNAILQWAKTSNIETHVAATGDSQFNGAVERFNKEIKIQYGILTHDIPDQLVKFFNRIIFTQIMLRLNTDRRSNEHSPNYYMFNKDVSYRYINKGFAPFVDLKIKTQNGNYTTGIHLGYDIISNRMLVLLNYKNSVTFAIQAIHHSNAVSLNSFHILKTINKEIKFSEEFRIMRLNILKQDKTTPIFMNNHMVTNSLKVIHPISLHKPEDILINLTDIEPVKIYNIKKLSLNEEHNRLQIIAMIRNHKHIPIKLALQVRELRHAMTTEITKWYNSDAVTPFDFETFKKHQSIKPEFATTFWLFTLKGDDLNPTFKARLITIDKKTVNTKVLPEHYSPVTNKISISALVHKALTDKLQLAVLDVAGAFLNAPTQHPLLLIKAPPAYNEIMQEIDPTFITAKMYKVQKALYGLKDSPLQWFKTLSSTYTSHNFQQSLYDECLIVDEDNPNISAAIHVDDILYIIDPKDTEDKIHSILKKRKLSTTNNKSNKLQYLGLTYTRSNDIIEIDLKTYISKNKNASISQDKIRDRPLPNFFSDHFEIIKALHTGLLQEDSQVTDENYKLMVNESTKLSKYNNDHIKQDFEKNQQKLTMKLENLRKDFNSFKNKNNLYIKDLDKYREYLGIVGYITSIHRYELSLYHILLSSFNTKYSEEAAHALQHLVSYIFNTENTKFIRRALTPINSQYIMHTYTDANWSRFGNSYTGTVISLNNEFIVGKCKKQTSFSTSTFLAELKALYQSLILTFEVAARYQTILKVNINNIIVHCDNQAVIQVVKSSVPLNGTIISNNLAHQVIQLRREFQENRFNIEYIRSKENPADLYTKPLGKVAFQNVLKLQPFQNNIHVQ